LVHAGLYKPERLNYVDPNTELKAPTDVRYALLRDIALKNITALPIAAGDKSAD
jgi:hypothetical protein